MTKEQAERLWNRGMAGRPATVSGAGVKRPEPETFDQDETCQRDYLEIGSTTDRPSLRVAKDLRG
jgi:hypothetical protein